jgi:secreted trypsin-like serine protease
MLVRNVPPNCYYGDSGGPIYVHNGNTNEMIAVATLYSFYEGFGDSTCYGELIAEEEKNMGLQLYQDIGP